MREILEEARRSSSQTPPSILNSVIAIDIYIGRCFPDREKLKESFVREKVWTRIEKEEKGERRKGEMLRAQTIARRARSISRI